MSEDLVEWDYGDAEGLTTAEIRATCPGWSLFGNGPPGGELLSNVAVRADRVIESLRHDPPGVSILFSHGHFLRVLAARWVGLQPEAGAHLALDAASVSILGDERETPVIRHWNGIDHLGG